MTRRLTLALLAPSLLLASLPAGCARNPVTGKSELSLVSESQEIQMGQQAAQEVAQTIGLYEDANIQAYVAGLGKQIAASSERPNLPWEFHVVDDASVNAFALPGGFIYVTRGLMTSINDEAELATVVGHEVGHVTNRHSVQQISKAQLAQLGLGIGSILSSDIARFGQLASAGLQILFLKYSRNAENQADEAGFRYALGQGYDVREMPKVFVTLDRISQASGGGGKLPEWLATHPNPENRIKHIESMLDTAHVDPSRLKVNKEDYLRRIQGMTFGDDPRKGYFEGTTFYHPDLRFQIQFPEGWKTQNLPQAILAASPNQDAVIQGSIAGKEDPQQLAQKFFTQQGIQPGRTSSSSINGNPAASGYFQAQTDQGIVEGLASFISYGGSTYMFVGYTPQGKLGNYDDTFRRTIGSFRRLDDPSKLNVRPAKLELVKLSRDMTLEQFNAQYPSSIPLEQLAIINEVEDPSSVLPAGRMVKRVVGGTRTQSS
jgi:predicted Zn-dependent protease